MAKGQYQIPFDKNGNQMEYDAWNVDSWVDNFIFEDELTYKTYQRGRSSALLIFERQDGKTVSVFMSDADVIIPLLINGKIKGKFTFVKKGKNYGCQLFGGN